MRKTRWIGMLAFVALGCVACGGEAPQVPAGPSSTGVPSAATQAATIRGNVSAGALPSQAAGTSLTFPVGFASATVAPAPMAVQVVGTPISSPVGTGGGFTLEGVPPGPVQLRFVGSGVDASVALSPVNPGDAVSVLIAVAGATATIESESRNAGGKVELEGRIESLPAAESSLVVAGRKVTTSAQTVFRDGNDAAKAFADLAIGQRVHVKGTLGVDSIVADSILIQNTNVAIPVNVNGIVGQLSGTAALFDFLIDGRKIKGDKTTVFFGDTGPLGFSALKDGARVEVKGEMRDGYVFAVRIHVNGPTTPEPPQDDSASVEGVVSALSGSGTAFTMTIGTTTVTTDAQTLVQRRGDVQTLAAIANGQIVHAVGVRQADGALLARKLQIKDDGPAGPFVIEGSLGGLKGVCPALTFGVNGFTVKASDATKYFPEPSAKCGDLKSGMKIEVAGTRQADGIVLAEKVTKQ